MGRKEKRAAERAAKKSVVGATADQMPGAAPTRPEHATGRISMLPPARGQLSATERMVIEANGGNPEDYEALEFDVILAGMGMAPDGTIVLTGQMVIPPKVTTMPTIHLAPNPAELGKLFVERLGIRSNGRVRLPVLKTALNDPAKHPDAPLDLEGFTDRPAVELDQE